MPRHDHLAPSKAEAKAAAALAARLAEQVQLAAAALRRDPRADCFPLIKELERTSAYLRSVAGTKQLYLINYFNQRHGGFSELLSACIRVDAAHDAGLCFVYPTEANPTLLGTVGDFLVLVTMTCLHRNINLLCRCGCEQGHTYIARYMQRALAPVLAQVIPQATTALNAAHAHLSTLPTPWPSSSPHKLLLGILHLTQVCLNWGGPPGDPKPYSTLITTLARERTTDAAIRLLHTLQDPTRVTHLATPAAFPRTYTFATECAFYLVHVTAPPTTDGLRSDLDANLALAPAGRTALRTHLLSHHHLLLHLLHTAAACCHALPDPLASATLPPTPAYTLKVREQLTERVQEDLKTAAAWLTDSTSASAPLHHQHCYTASPAAVWRGAAKLLAAVAQPAGWQVAGPKALELVEALPLSHLAEQHPELVLQVTQPLVQMLLEALRVAQQRSRQLQRHKPLLWELWTGLGWEARRRQASACTEATGCCLRLLTRMLVVPAGQHGGSGEGRQQELAAGSGKAKTPADEAREACVARLFTKPEARRELQQLLDDLRLQCVPHHPGSKDLRVMLQQALQDVSSLAKSLPEKAPAADGTNVFLAYICDSMVLVLWLVIAVASCAEAAMKRDWAWWREKIEPTLVEMRTFLRSLASIFSQSVACPLLLLEAYTGS